jgi:hypothetical protein
MIVFQVDSDLDYRQLYGMEEDPRYGLLEWSRLDCTRRVSIWNPPKLFVHEPLKPRGDFMGLQSTNLILRQSALDKIGYNPFAIDELFELLPIDFEEERMWVINVLKCYNVLDYDKTEWRGKPGKSTIRKHAFYASRLGDEPLFKFPEERTTTMVMAVPCVRSGFNLIELCKEHDLTGLKFVELWRDDGLPPGSPHME